MSGGIPRPPLPTPWWRTHFYSADKCEALAALLQRYFSEYPPPRGTLADRSAVLDYARRGEWGPVKYKLYQLGLPKDVQDIIEHSIALLE